MTLDPTRTALTTGCFLVTSRYGCGCTESRARTSLGCAANTRDEQRALIKPDPKRAKKFADLGAQYEVAGNYGAALDAYDEAAKYAPFDVTIVSKAVALRTRLVRTYVDDGERLAIQGDVDGAARNYALALRLIPRMPC